MIISLRVWLRSIPLSCLCSVKIWSQQLLSLASHKNWKGLAGLSDGQKSCIHVAVGSNVLQILPWYTFLMYLYSFFGQFFFNFSSVHTNTNICTFYSVHFQNLLFSFNAFEGNYWLFLHYCTVSSQHYNIMLGRRNKTETDRESNPQEECQALKPTFVKAKLYNPHMMPEFLP